MRLHVTKTELIEKETDFDVIIPDGTPEDEIKQIAERALLGGTPSAMDVCECGMGTTRTYFAVQVDADDNDVDGTEIEWEG